MSRTRNQLIATAVIILGNLIMWMVQGDVPSLIAREREVLLGRYSEGHFAVMLVVSLLSWPAIYLILARRETLKLRVFRVTAVLSGFFVGFLIIEIALLLWRSPRYVRTDNVYHRPPNSTFRGIFQDAPEPSHSYPNVPPGYPDVRYTLTVDALGFRNKHVHDRCDVLILGDSFGEGSNVSDDQVWGALYEARSGRSVYNLAMAGGNPSTYVETLQQFGLKFSPRIVVCLIYEGNDFRGAGQLTKRAEERATLYKRWQDYYKTSPMRLMLKRFFIKAFAFKTRSRPGDPEEILPPAERAVRGRESRVLSWIPVAIPPGPRAKYYAFNIKRLASCYADRQAVSRSDGCKTLFLAIRKMKEICERNGARLIIMFAPDAPHVVMPLAKDRVDPETLREFLALRMKGLPPPAETVRTLFCNMEAREEVTRDLCRGEGIEFVSLTRNLRDAIAMGDQAYFTYNEHWSPIGHQIVADTLYEHMSGSGL